MPEKEVLNKKPDRLGYQTTTIKYKHYGRNIQLMIKKALDLVEPEEKEAAVIHIGRLMKSFQNTWNRDNVEDVTILKNIEKMSNSELTIDLEKVKAENLFDSMIKERRKQLMHIYKLTQELSNLLWMGLLSGDEEKFQQDIDWAKQIPLQIAEGLFGYTGTEEIELAKALRAMQTAQDRRGGIPGSAQGGLWGGPARVQGGLAQAHRHR